MRYVWIIILVILDLIWLICTIKDIYELIRARYKFYCIICYTELYSKAFFITHLVVLALYSFVLYMYTYS